MKDEMKKHDYHREIIDKQYDELSPNYEDLYLRAGWNDPFECAKLVDQTKAHVSETTKNEDFEILDMGCGTGLVGQTLYDLGYRKVIGVDCSQGMLDEVEKTRPGTHS